MNQNKLKMKFLYLVLLVTFLACGPTEKEKEDIEKEIISIKADMVNLMKESSDLVIDIDAQKIYRSNIKAGEAKLKEIRDELAASVEGSDQAAELKRKEEFLIGRIAKEKEKLQSDEQVTMMEQDLRDYGKKYDSLDELLKKKTSLLQE